jgi:predicted dehydrogenase
MDVLRMAAVGIKGVGRGHVETIATDERTELVALADLDETAGQAMAAKHSARAYTDYRLLLEQEKPDAVVIATPHHLHAPMCLEALEAGAHVYLEKPIANRISEADRVVASAQEKGLVVAVGHQYRTFPGNVKLKEIIDSGLIGDLNRIVWQWLEARPETYYDRDIWRCTWKHAGGGVLMNQTSHDLDLLCWLAGEPVEVSAMIRNWGHRHEVEDTAVASISFASGALANVQLSTCSHCLNYRQLAGDKGMILFQDETDANVRVPEIFRVGTYDTSMREIIAGGAGTVSKVEPAWRDIDCTDALSPTLFDSFVTAISEGSTPITDAVSARRTIELINAIVLSGIRRKTVSLPIDREEYDDLMDELIRGDVKVP